MEIVEFDKPYFSSIEGLSGIAIEPNEPLWKRAYTPAHLRIMGLDGEDLRLDSPKAVEQEVAIEAVEQSEASEAGIESEVELAWPGPSME